MVLTKISLRILLLAFASVLLMIPATAQESEKKVTAKAVPEVVIANFKAVYPKAVIRGYASETENGRQYYEVESREGSVRRDVLYNPGGTVAEIEESIEQTALPAAALRTFKEKHPRGVITLVEKKTVGDKISYEIAGREGRSRFTMAFDADGNLLPKEK